MRCAVARAICLRCGRAKLTWSDGCAACGFDPRDEGIHAQVRSSYLSVSRFDEVQRHLEYKRELDGLGNRIMRGEPIDYDAADLENMRGFLAEGRGWRPSDS